MIKIWKPERVEWIGEGMFRMHVRGNSGTYLVDLEEIGGNGWCGCQDFEMNRMPLLRLGLRSDRTRCKHIKLAIESLGKMVAQFMRMQQAPANQDAYYLLGNIASKRLRQRKMTKFITRYGQPLRQLEI